MNVFEDREKALEQIYFLDCEMAFRVRSRRDRLLARWVCTMTGAVDIEAYLEQLVDIRVASADDEGLIAKILADLNTSGKDIGERALRERMDMLTAGAARDLAHPS